MPVNTYTGTAKICLCDSNARAIVRAVVAHWEVPVRSRHPPRSLGDKHRNSIALWQIITGLANFLTDVIVPQDHWSNDFRKKFGRIRP